MFHQQDGHPHQHSPVQRVLHVCRSILALTFSVVLVVEKYSTRLSKILKSASFLLLFWFVIIIIILFTSALLLTGWLEVSASTKAVRSQVPSSAAREASGRCARQINCTEGEGVSGLPASRHFSRTYFEKLCFLPCEGSITKNLLLQSAVATRRGAAVHRLPLKAGKQTTFEKRTDLYS